MSKDLFGKYADNVLREYLKAERSLRRFYDENYDCSICPPGETCCESKVSVRGMELLSLWDHYVLKRTFPEYESYEEKHADGDPRCSYLSDKGCMIPEGRPAICTKYSCPSQRKKRDYVTNRAIMAFYHISINMSKMISSSFSDEKDSEMIHDVDATFKDIEKLIRKGKKFSEKYEYESIFSSRTSCS